MKFICPLIVVEDIARSRFLYETLLGQKVKADFGENITFEGDFAIHRKDHFRSLIGGRQIVAGSNSGELYFENNDPDMIQQLALANNLELVHEVREQPWRQRVLRFYDYDRNMIEVGESMEHVAWRLSAGLSIDEISRITYLPVEAVMQAIETFNSK